MAKLRLRTGEEILVDEEDAAIADSREWSALRCSGGLCYAQSFRSGKTVLLHRLIVNAPDGMDVDHVNGDGLDNRRQNLRLCTHAQNMRNKKRARSNTSGFKGVVRDGRPLKKPWQASVKVNGKRHYLGRYATPEEAHAAYCAGAGRLHGEFARFA